MKATNPSPSVLSAPMLYIVLAVAAEPRHGYEIMKLVEKESGGTVKIGPGTLYGAIKRLLEEGYISEKGGDARRRFYRATPKGTAAISGELDRYRLALTIAKKVGAYPLSNGAGL